MSANAQITIEAIDKTKAAFAELEKSIKGTQSTAQTATSGIGASLKQLQASWMALTVATAAAVAIGRKAIDSYMEEEKAQMKLAVALRNQGDFTRENFAALKDYAAQIQQTTAYADDAALATMANLTTYGMNTEELKRATQASLDLATAKGMDLVAASELVGKAFVGETGTLSRYGIVVEDGIKKTAKFDAVLGQINQRFGGSAAAELETYSGQWRQLANWWGDIAEVGGLALLKTLEALQVGAGLFGAAFYGLLEELVSGLRALSEAAEMIPGIGPKMAGVTSHLRTIESGFKAAGDEALQFGVKNFKMLTSFDRVETAAEKMGNGSKRVIRELTEEEKKAAERRKELLLQSVEDRARAVEDEMLELSKGMQAEQEERVKYWEDTVKIAREGSIAALQETLDAGNRAELAKSAAFENNKKIDAERRAAREADIKSQIAEIDMAELAGTAHRDTLTARIRLQEELLQIQRASLATIDKERDPASWYAQTEAIEREGKALLGLTNEQIAAAGSFAQGWDRALRDMDKNLRSTFDQGKYMAEETAKAMEGAFSDFFFDVFQGKLKSLGDYVTSFLSAVQRAIANALAQMAATGLMNAVASGISKIGAAPGSNMTSEFGTIETPVVHGGGVLNSDRPMAYRFVPANTFDHAPRYHNGIGPGERAAIIRDDEGVFTQGQMKALGNLAGGEEGKVEHHYHYAVTVNVPITAMDSQSVSQHLSQHQGQIVGMVQMAFNRMGQRGPLGK